MENDIYLELVTQYPIKFDNLIIRQPTFREIKDFGINNYYNLLYPFMLHVGVFDIPEEDVEKVNFFSDILMGSQEYMLNIVIALRFFTNASDIGISEDGKSLICVKDETETIIDDTNFNTFSDIILKMNDKEKIEVEKPPKNMSEKQRDVWQKLHEGREREKQKNVTHLYDVLNICEFGGNYHIPIETMLNWSLWRIMNCYHSIINRSSYNDGVKFCLVGGDVKNINGNNHWTKKLMVGKK